MSKWKNRTTRLTGEDVKVSVISYKDYFGRGWWTMFTVHTGDEPIDSSLGKKWRDADARHDKLVHIAELMGYRVFSEEVDGKEKTPDAAATAQGAEK